MSERPTGHVYIDGFNLYYGVLKGYQGRKWLDLSAWAARVLPQCEVQRIVYCTARSQGRVNDPGLHQRQDRYLRALAASGLVEILEGQFKSTNVKAFRTLGAKCGDCGAATGQCSCGSNFIKVQKTEEKGSDVNLAVELVKDALTQPPTVALVVSGDSDLQRAVDIARGAGVQVLIADPRNRGWALKGDGIRRVSPSAIEACQFEETVAVAHGRTVIKPPDW